MREGRNDAEMDADMGRLMFEMDEAHARAAYQSRLLDDDGNEIGDGDDEYGDVAEGEPRLLWDNGTEVEDADGGEHEPQGTARCTRGGLDAEGVFWSVVLAAMLGAWGGCLVLAPLIGIGAVVKYARRERWPRRVVRIAIAGGVCFGVGVGVYEIGRLVAGICAEHGWGLVCQPFVSGALWWVIVLCVVRAGLRQTAGESPHG